MKLISSRENAQFKEWLKLTESARQRRKLGLTLLDGTHLLDAALQCGAVPDQVIVTEAGLRDAEVAALLQRLPDTPVVCIGEALFAELSELKTVTGILSLCAIPSPKTAAAHSRFALLLEEIQDPGNLGSMLRSAAAAGCDAVFLSKGCADAWSPKVLRAAMGGHYVLSIHEHADLMAVAAALPGTLYAAALQSEANLYRCDLHMPVAFAVGNEGAGLSDALQAQAMPVRIPMPGQVESLNAAAAAAICLFEAVRQNLT